MNAKLEFKKALPGVADTLREESQKVWFRASLVYALADLCSHGATAEELNGANRFIELLTTLALDEEMPKRLPVKSLEFLDAAQPTGGTSAASPKHKKS